MSKAREWNCMLNTETGELTYAYRHGCIDGFEDIHVIEKSAYDALMEQANKLSAEFAHLQKAVHERGGDCDDKTGCCFECKYAAQALADFEKWKAGE